MSKYRQDLEAYLKTVDVNCQTCLDIGGSAYPIEKRVKSWNVKDYKILDNNNEKGLHDKWREPDYIADLDNDPLFEKAYRYERDIIFCLEVFEYVVTIPEILQDIYDLLNDEGILYVTTCEKYPVHNPIESDSSRLTKVGFEKLIKWKFEILECIPRRYSPEAFKHLQSAWRIDGLRVAKHFPDHDVVGHIWKLKKK